MYVTLEKAPFSLTLAGVLARNFKHLNRFSAQVVSRSELVSFNLNLVVSSFT